MSTLEAGSSVTIGVVAAQQPSSSASRNITILNPLPTLAYGSITQTPMHLSRGAKLYGTYPTLALNGPDDSGVNGRWIPSTGSVQYASTLARWFGVGASQLRSILPSLDAFPSANLGFV